MILYNIKIKVRPYKSEEFQGTIGALLPGICNHRGCLGFNFYWEPEAEDTYMVVGEWQTRKAMEKHFGSHDFQILIGAAKVLGETIRLQTAEVLETGGFELAQKKIKSHHR